MDSRLHGNDGKMARRKEGDRKEKERGHSCPLPLVPSEKMEISKKEREREAVKGAGARSALPECRGG